MFGTGGETIPGPGGGPTNWYTQYQNLQAQQPSFQQVYQNLNQQWGPNGAPNWAVGAMSNQANIMSGGAPFFDPKRGFTSGQMQLPLDAFFYHDVPLQQGAINRSNQFRTQTINTLRRSGREGGAELMDLSKTIGEDALSFGRRGVIAAEEGLKQFMGEGEGAIAATSSGLDRQVQSEIQQLDQQLARGEISQDAYQALKQQKEYEGGVMRTNAVMQARQGLAETAAGLRNAIASANISAGGIATNVAEVRSNLAQFAQNFEFMAEAAAGEFGMRYPESVMAITPGILQIMGLASGTAPAPQPNMGLSILQALSPLGGALLGNTGLFGGNK